MLTMSCPRRNAVEVVVARTESTALKRVIPVSQMSTTCMNVGCLSTEHVLPISTHFEGIDHKMSGDGGVG